MWSEKVQIYLNAILFILWHVLFLLMFSSLRVEYESMRAAYKDKGRSRHSKSESFSTEQLQASFLEYQEEAALFIFRLRSLKQGQFLSILTQAARHHAAQVT